MNVISIEPATAKPTPLKPTPSKPTKILTKTLTTTLTTKTPVLLLTASIAMIVACADKTAVNDDYEAVLSEPATSSQLSNPVSQPTTSVEGKIDNKHLEEVAVISQEVVAAQYPANTSKEMDRSRLLSKGVSHFEQPTAKYKHAQIHPVHQPVYYQDRENYQQRSDNPVYRVSDDPVSTFSVDVDTAGYSNVRRMLAQEGRLPPKDAVKAEEMINYFSYDYDLPDRSDHPFSVNTSIAPAPWNNDRYVFQVGLKGFEPAMEERPNANLVFLVDVSGSMQSPNKLGLVKKSLRMLVNKMARQDTIALAVYAGAAGMVLEPTSGNDKAKILNAIDSLEAGGSTNGGAGIHLAYNLAQRNFIKGGINRVIVASDGDMNVGTVNIEALKNLVEEKRKTGIALTTLGFGGGNYNDALMEKLADVGNGNAAYIDSLREANKVLVKEMQSTLHTIAKDVKIQIEFNPSEVAEYRLIGYQNRLLNIEDFKNDKIDAGEIGAGHTVTALYELTMVDAKNKSIPPSRYQPEIHKESPKTDEVAFVKLRYKQPNGDRSTEFSQAVNRTEILHDINQANTDLRFASAVAGFSELLRGGHFTGEWTYPQLLSLARSAKGDDKHGYRSEFIGLVELAQSFATPIASYSNESAGQYPVVIPNR